MATPQANGHSGPTHGPADPPTESPADLIGEAEALRAVLQDAAGRVARLLAALKHQRRQSRAVQQAMDSLRQLSFDR